MRVLDAYAGTADLAGDYSEAYSSYLSARREYEAASRTAERSRADHEYYSHQLDEFRAAQLVSGVITSYSIHYTKLYEKQGMMQEQQYCVISSGGSLPDFLNPISFRSDVRLSRRALTTLLWRNMQGYSLWSTSIPFLLLMR